jgi:hypothetical protein
MELSYSQNLEDYQLSLAFAGQTTGTYIDAGAGHPVAGNVSYWFYEQGWRRIAIEPQPALERIAAEMRTETFRASLGRVASGYDGGQIIDK